jgi:protein involved in polysaccharide export with SLBB domain
MKLPLLAACCLALLSPIPAAEPGIDPWVIIPKATFTQQPQAAGEITGETSGLPPAGTLVEDLHRLRAGDKVSYQVIEDREPAKLLVVADSGELDLPCLGRVGVAGKSCRELAAEIKAALERDYYYRATVILGLEQASRWLGRVYVWGQVRNQGAVDLLASERLTAAKAILRAGGFSDFANRKRVKVIRGGNGGESQIFEVNLAEVLEEGRIELDIPLRPDDAVVVGSRVIRF